MKKFQFKFEAVEKVKKTRETHALRVLGEAQRAHQEAVRRKHQLLGELEQALIRREALGADPIPTTPFQVENDYIVGTKQRIVQADHGIARAMRGVEKALRGYLFARREMRMVEVLREKEYAEYRRNKNKYEEREQSDLYVMRARIAKEEQL